MSAAARRKSKKPGPKTPLRASPEAFNSTIRGRSGKVARQVEMLEEVIKAGDRALIFTQFAEMGIILRRHLEETFGREVLWVDGQVPKAQRDRMGIAFSPPAAINLVSRPSLSRPVGQG
jgi:SNF2 family DNA or RNA helicase